MAAQYLIFHCVNIVAGVKQDTGVIQQSQLTFPLGLPMGLTSSLDGSLRV